MCFWKKAFEGSFICAKVAELSDRKTIELFKNYAFSQKVTKAVVIRLTVMVGCVEGLSDYDYFPAQCSFLTIMII